MSKVLFSLIIIIILPVFLGKNHGNPLSAQQSPIDTLTHKQKVVRKSILFGTMGAYTAISLTFLDVLWYRSSQTTNFHFFNDNAQWCQMDKFGHAFSAYSSARLVMQTMDWAGFKTSPFNASLGHLSSGGLRWAGFSEKESIIIGQTFGILYLSSVEILDGFSKEWGFSWGDEAANFAGGFAFSLQQYYWGQQRIQLKFSTHPTDFPKYRPNILGSNPAEQIIKDYNGQTYWLALNLSSFLKKGNKFPKWINLAFGYGAANMISGKNNVIVYSDGNIGKDYVNNQTELLNRNGQINYFYRYRKYYISLDIDFTKIKTKSRFLRSIFSVINGFKLPFPTIQFDKYGSHFRGFYF